MELFRYRNLALGCLGFISGLFLSYYLGTIFSIIFLALSLVSLLTLVIIYLIKKKRSVLDLIIKYAPLCFLIALSMAISIFVFGSDDKKQEYYGQDLEIVATIKEEKYEKPYEGKYIIEINKIGEKDIKLKAILVVPNGYLNVNDKFSTRAMLSSLEEIEGAYSQAYLEKRIFTYAEAEECTILDVGDDKEDIFSRLNSFLSMQYENNLNEETSALFSSLLLGNDHLLDQGVRRDFSRIGISHVLALSGLHITLITTLLGLGLRITKMPRILKGIIMIFAIAFFVALTGFSMSAVRAGLMMCIFWSLSLFGFSTDTLTSLFLSVTLILIFQPYAIFSVSLQLSFLALLGCIVSSKFIRRAKIGRWIRNKILRYITYTLVASLFVMGFTMPVLWYNFGSISLMTPLSNLIFVPVFTCFIYFAPFLLALINVPYISNVLVFVAEKSTEILLNIIEKIASIRGIVVPIYNTVQIIGIIAIIAVLAFVMIVKRKHLLKTFALISIGVLLLVGGSLSNFIVKSNNSYVSAKSDGKNDYIALEAQNRIAIVDISTTSTGKNSIPISLMDSLGYTEIDSYIVLDYSHLTDKYLEKILKWYIVRELYLPAPESEKEIEVFEKIKEITNGQVTKIKFLPSELRVIGYKLDINESDTLARSEKRAVSLGIEKNGIELAYFGSATYELFDYYTAKKSKTADIAIFGSYGPTYKQEYSYEMDYLDVAIYFGESYDFARDEMKNATRGKEFVNPKEHIRIKIDSP